MIEEGNGTIPTSTSLVQVYYKGWLIDGREFDSNLEDELPAIFRVYEVIDGWQQILKVMPAGSTWEIYIPYKLGYGSRGDGMIKGYSTLIFQVKLVSVA
ncbi:MAG: FKBP-type peptidyl-prolyl cis-trans isomerase [Bacteroidales bacterium]